jgi:hypothetical protein
MVPIEQALSSLATGLHAWANELGVLGDVLDARVNADLHRLGEFSALRELCTEDHQAVLGSTVTVARRGTRDSFCIAVAVAAAPSGGSGSSLLSWQYGFWCDSIDHEQKFISGVFALPADSGKLLVLEQLGPAADPVLREFIERISVAGQAFVSYVHEDASTVDRLCRDLKAQGVATWRDRDKLAPGVRWKDAIRQAIEQGSAFVACFSKAYEARPRTYMNEELNIAVEELRLRPRNRSWFYPVLLDGAQVPAIPIGPGETLRDLHSVSLASDWTTGVSRLARSIRTA